MKVLFLDIDGVLNSHDWCDRTAENPSIDPAGEKWKGIITIDPDAVELLKEIIETTGCEVVLSSTWRIHMRANDEAWREIVAPQLCNAGIDVENMPITPIINTPGSCRGQEIHAWLLHNAPVENFCIVDDDSDMLDYQMPNFVKTSFRTGMLREHADKIIEILGENSE